MMDLDEVSADICSMLTLAKLDLLKDFDINYRPGYRVVLEQNLQNAKDYGIKEYKICRRYIDINNLDVDSAIDYLKKESALTQIKIDETKAKKTDDHDAPIRELWSYMAKYTGLQTLMKQITDSDIKIL